jgi:hypothetical protein
MGTRLARRVHCVARMDSSQEAQVQGRGAQIPILIPPKQDDRDEPIELEAHWNTLLDRATD